MQGEGLKGVKREFKLGHTIVTFQEATCVIDGEITDCLYIVEEGDNFLYDFIVTNCCTLPETEDEVENIMFNEYLESNYEILDTMRFR